MMEPIPLTGEDRAILALEGPALAGHTCKVIVLEDGAPSASELALRVHERLGSAPALGRRLGGTAAQPAWVEDPRFDVRSHVVAEAHPAPLDHAGLRVEVARLFTQRLDRERPLWRIDRLPLQGGGVALVWRIHHALADGSTAMGYARAVLWDEPVPTAAGGRSGARGAGRGEAGKAPAGGAGELAQNEADHRRRRAHLVGFFAREFGRSLRDSPFDGGIGARREVAFAVLPLQELHDAAGSIDSATLNDAVLTVVAGGLRRWLERHHGHLGSLRVKVPVSLHDVDGDPGNRDSFFSLPVPLQEQDPAARLRAVHAATTLRKAEHDAEAMDGLLRELRRASPGLGRLCERIERSPRAFAINVSNVVGPRRPVSVIGAPVSSLHSLAELAMHHAVRVCAVSLAETLHLGFCADPAIVEGVESIAEGTELEAAALIARS
jgi:WS/DGAT/MGAT family acyltransferase